MMIMETPKYIIEAYGDSGMVTIKQAYGKDREPVRLEADDIGLFVQALIRASQLVKSTNRDCKG